MTVFSLLINILIFFLLVNIRYFGLKRRDPHYPQKPFAQMVVFPIALGIAFTLLFDIIKGFMFYQFIIFGVVAAFLYWLFYMAGRK